MFDIQVFFINSKFIHIQIFYKTDFSIDFNLKINNILYMNKFVIDEPTYYPDHQENTKVKLNNEDDSENNSENKDDTKDDSENNSENKDDTKDDSEDDSENDDNRVEELKNFMIECENKIIDYFPGLYAYDDNNHEHTIQPYKAKISIDNLTILLIFKQLDKYSDYFLSDVRTIRTGDIYFDRFDELSEACAHAFNSFFTSNYNFFFPPKIFFKFIY